MTGSGPKLIESPLLYNFFCYENLFIILLEIFMLPFEPNTSLSLPIPKSDCGSINSNSSMRIFWPDFFDSTSSLTCNCQIDVNSMISDCFDSKCQDDIDVELDSVILPNVNSECGNFFVHFACEEQKPLIQSILPMGFYFTIITSYNLTGTYVQ